MNFPAHWGNLYHDDTVAQYNELYPGLGGGGRIGGGAVITADL